MGTDAEMSVPNDFTFETMCLLKRAEKIAMRPCHDGHLTILRFTTGWKVTGCTPQSRYDIEAAPLFPSLADALRSFLFENA